MAAFAKYCQTMEKAKPTTSYYVDESYYSHQVVDENNYSHHVVDESHYSHSQFIIF